MTRVSPLVHRTRELLKHRDRTKTFEVMARETGLNRRWLEDFAWGTDKEYGVNRVTLLYEYLAGKQLEVA